MTQDQIPPLQQAPAAVGALATSAPESDAVTIKLRAELLSVVTIFVAFVLVILNIFMGGVEVSSFESAAFDDESTGIFLSDCNMISSSIVSLVGIPVDYIMDSIVSVFFLVFASNEYARADHSFCLKMSLFLASGGLKYLISNGFNGFNAQAVMKRVVPYIVASDVAASTYIMDSLARFTTSVSNNLVPETTMCNVITNTVLRNVLAPAFALESAPSCSNNQQSATARSEFAQGLVQSFGFPIHDWQQWMGIINCDSNGASIEVSSTAPLNSGENVADPATAFLETGMSIEIATNTFIHGMHVSRQFFRWFDTESLPFNVSGLIQTSARPDIVGSSASAGSDIASAPIHSIPAADLLNLTLPQTGSYQTALAEAEWFLKSTRDLFKKSLATAVNISQDEAALKFTHTAVARNITFDAVTFEVLLRRNFYYRKLVFNTSTNDLVENSQATATYANIANADIKSDIHFDLDMRADCGSYPYSCVMPRVQEYDSKGHEYQPNAQIRATAICLNANGTEDFQIDYKFYANESAPFKTQVHAAWACNNRSSTSMWIVSLGSRIEAHDMYDRPAPDASKTPLDGHRATIVNPLQDLLAHGEGKCRGMRYRQVYTLDKDIGWAKYIIVGEASIPSKRLEPYAYNNTESGDSKLGAATRWVSLMTLTTPMDDAMHSQKGDVALRYNLAINDSWSAEQRKGENCSLSAEDHLNHVMNNHYFMDNAIQPAYVSGLYFLFQNGVIREVVNATSSGSEVTLDFDGNVMWMKVLVSTPDWSAAISFIGLGIIYMLAVVSMFWTCCGNRALLTNSSTVSAERLADLKISWLLDCHVAKKQVKLDDISLVESASPAAEQATAESESCKPHERTQQ